VPTAAGFEPWTLGSLVNGSTNAPPPLAGHSGLVYNVTKHSSLFVRSFVILPLAHNFVNFKLIKIDLFSAVEAAEEAPRHSA
jgi:hypothetical protein